MLFRSQAHQSAPTGAPILSDGTCVRASMRAWGAMMSSIYTTEEKELDYMDFYMDSPVEKMPEDKEINVEPSNEESAIFGLTIMQDKQLVVEALQMGMPLMTTDKVVSDLYNYYKEELEKYNEDNTD